MSGKLSTHVLDTASGAPASGVSVVLRFLGTEGRVGSSESPQASGAAGGGETVARTSTNADGRTDAPLLSGGSMRAGSYSLVFGVGEYYRRGGHPDAGRFLEEVVVMFRVDDPDADYHVPLLVTPWSYSTYRGS